MSLRNVNKGMALFVTCLLLSLYILNVGCENGTVRQNVRPLFIKPLSNKKLGDIYKSQPFKETYGPSDLQVGDSNLNEFFGSQKKKSATDGITDVANRLHLYFNKVAREEMGHKIIQASLDKEHYTTKTVDGERELDKLEKGLHRKILLYTTLINNNKMVVEELHAHHLKTPMDHRFDCCNLAEPDLRRDPVSGINISLTKSCDLIPRSVPLKAFNPGRNLTAKFIGYMKYSPPIKWLYFITSDGLHTEFPAHNFRAIPPSHDCSTIHQIRHRDVFVRSVRPDPMWILIVLDHGEMSSTQLERGKRVASIIINSLSEKDRLALLTVSHTVAYPTRSSSPRKPAEAGSDRGCTSKLLFPGHQEARQMLHDYLDALRMPRRDARMNHTLAVTEAFALIEATLDSVSHTPEGKNFDNILIAYISRGHVSNLFEIQKTLAKVHELQGRLKNRVVINTYMLVDDRSSTLLYEPKFMLNLATQWWGQENITFDYPPRPGSLLTLNRTTSKQLETTVMPFYRSLARKSRDTDAIQYSLPYRDVEGGGLVLSMSKPYYIDGSLIGVFGLDLHLADFVDTVTYFNRDKWTSAFLIHRDGYTVMHPSLNRPITAKAMPVHTDIRHFEKYPGFSAIRHQMLTRRSGNATLNIPVQMKPEEIANGTERVYEKITYHWRHILPDTPFIVVLKTFKRETGKKISNRVSKLEHINYHRLDYFERHSACVYLKNLATFAHSTLFLSARAFKSPFGYLSGNETREDAQIVVAFLGDNTNLIYNSNVLTSVRGDAALLEIMDSYWTAQHKNSEYRDFIVRRYMATNSGVMRIYPGALMDTMFDPTTREWYRKALNFPGKMVFTGPYLDAGGAGYIVTMSYTIFEGRSDSQHDPERDSIMGVIALDLTFRSLYLLLLRENPWCDRPSIRCLVMEDQGYLVAHPGFLQPRPRGPSESNHITHREALIADHMLNHGQFVRKTVCNSFNDRTIQRRYSFNMSLDRPLTNLAHGEHCAKYQIVLIPGTNAFLGLINETSNPLRCRPSFCPCSTMNRECLNCNRMKQKECECPCECPLTMDLCSGRLLQKEDDDNPSCPRSQETDLPLRPKINQGTPDCLGGVSFCSSRSSKSLCSGIVNCEWCEVDEDEKTPLRRPFCALQEECIGGVLRALSPYTKQIRDLSKSSYDTIPTGIGALGNLQPDTRSTPVGPVTGGVMGCFILIALGVYCYRHRALRRAVARHNYEHTINENQGGFEELLDDPSNNDDASLVFAQYDPAGISPYRVNTGYRRPVGPHSTTTTGRADMSTDVASTDQGYNSVVGGVETDQENASTVVSEAPLRSVVSEPDSAVGSSVAGSECHPRHQPPPSDVTRHHPLMHHYPAKTIRGLQMTNMTEIYVDQMEDGQPIPRSQMGKVTGQQLAVPVQIHTPPSCVPVIMEESHVITA